MKVANKPAVSSMHAVHIGALRPTVKAAIETTGRDQRMVAAMLVNEIIAHVMVESNPWRAYAHRVIDLTTDGRVFFLEQIGKQLSEMRKENTEILGVVGRDGKIATSKDDARMAGALVSSATVYVSQLKRIAQAFNSGADVEGLCEYVNQRNNCKGTALADVSLAIMYEYSGKFVKSAAGRKAKSFAEKLAKFLETNPAAEDDTAGAVLHAKVAALLA